MLYKNNFSNVDKEDLLLLLQYKDQCIVCNHTLTPEPEDQIYAGITYLACMMQQKDEKYFYA